MTLDNFRTIELIWDKANKSIIKTIKTASSDTTGRYLSVKILDGGQEVTLNNATLQLYWEHPNFNTSGTDDFNTVNNGGLFKMTFSKEMLTNIGELNAYLVLTLSDGKITSDKFKIEVIKGADDGVVVPTNGSGLVEQVANKIDRGNVTLNDLTQEVKTAMTGGSVAVVGENAVGTENIKDSSVTAKKTDFLKISSAGKNMYNPNDADLLPATLINPDGTTSPNANFEVTGYMPVKAGDVVYASRSGGSTSPMFRTWVLYSQSKVFISGDAPANNGPVTITHDGYLRVSHNHADTHYQLEVGTQATSYEPYREIYEIDRTIIQIPEAEDGIKITRNTSLSKNLYNPDEVIKNRLINTDGTMINNGTYGVTGKIPVEEYQYVSVSRGDGSSSSPLIRTYVWFDGNDNPIGGSNDGALSPIQAPQGARWLQITHNPLDVNYQVEIGSAPTSYEPFVAGQELDGSIVKNQTPKYLTSLHGKKLVANGDSIMAGQFPADPTGYETRKYMFIQQVADTFGMTLSNHAIGGSTVAVSTDSPNERNPLVERYQDMPDGDLIMISIGTNDWANSWTEIGNMASRSNNTFYGAMHNLCLGLMSKYQGKQIVLMTPIKRSYGTVLALPESTNTYGKTLSDYAEMIKEIGGYYGIPVIDMYNECILNPHLESQRIAYVPDGTHPNTEGHTIMARRVIGYLKQLV